MDYDLIIDTLDSYLLINGDVLEQEEYDKIYDQLITVKLLKRRQEITEVFIKKLDEWTDYYRGMLLELGNESPAEHGLDPEFNIDEIINELKAIG